MNEEEEAGPHRTAQLGQHKKKKRTRRGKKKNEDGPVRFFASRHAIFILLAYPAPGKVPKSQRGSGKAYGNEGNPTHNNLPLHTSTGKSCRALDWVWAQDVAKFVVGSA
jgi:hypothetical protein